MPKNSTQQQEINRRRQIISKLRHEGVRAQADIAERLKDDYGFEVTQQTVSNDLKALDKLWRTSAIDEIDKWKKEIAAQYRYIYQQSLTAWELSLEDAEETTTGGKDGTTKKEKGQSGNPALLAQAQAALKAIREMFGVDAAKAGESDDKPFIVKVVYGSRDNPPKGDTQGYVAGD
jgi:hypothetical protein